MSKSEIKDYNNPEFVLKNKDIKSLTQIGKGTTAEIYLLPDNRNVVKLFPQEQLFRNTKPSHLWSEDRLSSLLDHIRAADVPLVPNTHVVKIKSKKYHPRGIIMENVTGKLESIYDDVVYNNDQETCIPLSQMIGKLHSNGVVIDSYEKGSTSSHVVAQLFSIFSLVDNKPIIFDWSNLSLIEWFPRYNTRRRQQIWLNEMKRDLTRNKGFNLLFPAVNRQYLEEYFSVFNNVCPDAAVIDQHSHRINSLIGLYF